MKGKERKRYLKVGKRRRRKEEGRKLHTKKLRPILHQRNPTHSCVLGFPEHSVIPAAIPRSAQRRVQKNPRMLNVYIITHNKILH